MIQKRCSAERDAVRIAQNGALAGGLTGTAEEGRMASETVADAWYQHRRELKERQDRLRLLLANLSDHFVAHFEEFEDDPLTGATPVIIRGNDDEFVLESVTNERLFLRIDLRENAIRLDHVLRTASNAEITIIYDLQTAIAGREPQIVFHRVEKRRPEPPETKTVDLSAVDLAITRLLLKYTK
jgi:hypothetical protein